MNTLTDKKIAATTQKIGRQTGAALISVLLIFAVITILAAQLITRSQLDIERTRWLITEAQAYQYALSGEAQARQLLYSQQEMLKAESQGISVIPKKLPNYYPGNKDDGNKISIEIIDEQGLLNLNNVSANSEHDKVLKNLFNDLMPKSNLLPYLIDWVDTDTNPQMSGAEDFRYFSREPAYRTPNQFIASPSELLALMETEAEEYQQASHLFSTLPKSTPININTAPEEVLQAINPELSGSQVINYREQSPNGFPSLEAFLASEITAGIGLETAPLTVTSNYYAIKIKATVNDRTVWLKSRLMFDQEKMKITLTDRVQSPPFVVNVLEIESNQGSVSEVESDANTEPRISPFSDINTQLNSG